MDTAGRSSVILDRFNRKVFIQFQFDFGHYFSFRSFGCAAYSAWTSACMIGTCDGRAAECEARTHRWLTFNLMISCGWLVYGVAVKQSNRKLIACEIGNWSENCIFFLSQSLVSFALDGALHLQQPDGLCCAQLIWTMVAFRCATQNLIDIIYSTALRCEAMSISNTFVTINDKMPLAIQPSTLSQPSIRARLPFLQRRSGWSAWKLCWSMISFKFIQIQFIWKFQCHSKLEILFVSRRRRHCSPSVDELLSECDR